MKVIDLKFRDGDSCPNCGSHRVIEGPKIRREIQLDLCGDCHRAWERETRASPVSEPCDNCAFRPGSPEMESGEIFTIYEKAILGSTIFYCHKRVPFIVDQNVKFEHRVSADGRKCTNATVCAGWIKAKQEEKKSERETEHGAAQEN